MNRATAAVVLPLRFGRALVTAGVQTVGAILRHGLSIGTPAPTSFVRITFAPMSAGGATLLGCLITLTPGSTVVDIDLARRQMVLHLLDAGDGTATAEVVRRELEPPILAWFGTSR